MSYYWPLRVGIVLFVLSAILLGVWQVPSQPVTATAGQTISTLDPGPVSFSFAAGEGSLALDSLGNPVVMYPAEGTVRVLRCNDLACAGGDEEVNTPDASGTVAGLGSMTLDAFGYPVVPYFDNVTGYLKLLHCNDVACANGDDSITVVLESYQLGQGASVAIHPSGNPFISYSVGANYRLRTVACNDPLCSGGDEVAETHTDCCVNTTSTKLDSIGYPVVAFGDGIGQGDLRILHCASFTCPAGEGSLTVPDALGNVGIGASLALDSDGFPVVAYSPQKRGDLKILHCNDANCSGDDEQFASPDTEGDVGHGPSLALDASGYPVVSYFDNTNDDLKVMHCSDAACQGSDESIAVPDSAGRVGAGPSLVLDADGKPVVSYLDLTNSSLKLLHCGDPTCKAPLPPPTPTPCPLCVPAFSVGADLDGDGSDDCGTKGGTVVCEAFPGASIRMKIYLDSLPAGAIEYRDVQLFVSWANTYVDDIDWVPFGCGTAHSGAWVRSRCTYMEPVNFMGLLAWADFTCPEEAGMAAAALLHGTDLTYIKLTSSSPQLSESSVGADVLQVDCSGEPFPPAAHTATATPTSTATPTRTVTATSAATRTPTPTSTPTSDPTSAPGDVDCSAVTTAIDAALILQLVAAIIDALPCDGNADLDSDGEITPIDAAIVLQLVSGLLQDWF